MPNAERRLSNGNAGRLARFGASGLILLFLSSLLILIHPSLNAQAVNPQSLYGRDTTQSVYVRDSAIAVEKFALAERMEHLKEWDKSADVYMEILRNYADRVVPSQIDDENKIYQYTSVTPAVQERLAKWPEEGLAVYCARYEGEASAALEGAADDPATLHRVFSHYFVTESARNAAIRLIDLYFERGEFAAAAWTTDRLLAWHPSIQEQRPRLLYRAALSHHLGGNTQLAQARFDELKNQFPQAIGTVRGTDVVLADSLAQELGAAGVTASRTLSGDSWPIAFGSLDRSRVPQVNGFGGARLFSIETEPSRVRTITQAQLREVQNQTRLAMEQGHMTGIFPVVDRGELFFHDNARVYAVSLESGYPLPGWAETYGGEQNGRFAINVWPNPRGHQQTLTVTDDAVLAIMGQPDHAAMQATGTYGQRETRLVCLDRQTGKQRWSIQPRQFPEHASNLRSLEMNGSPLVVGDTVYIQGSGGKGAQFEDSYVLAFELSSGKFKWACYIASASTNSLMEADPTSLLRPNIGHIAYSSGRLYAMTNLGVLAAIDAYDGTIVWLNIYPRDVVEANRNFGLAAIRRARTSASTGSRPWMHNPVIVTQQKVFVLPADGLNAHIYDAGSGVEIQRIRLSDFGNAQTLLGVVDDKMVVCSDRQVFCINWPKYVLPANADKNLDNLHWAIKLQKSGMPESSILGRGFVTSEHVIIPTAWQLLRLSLRNGAVLQSYPPAPASAWGEDEGPGNVLVTQDRLIIAGPGTNGRMRVNVYTDLAMAMAKLDAAVQAAPDDPEPRLRYAEIMFVAGKLDVATNRLDEAMRLVMTGGARDAAVRDRLFTTTMSFAQKLAKEKNAQGIESAAAMYDRAAAVASNPSQQVNYRMTRALFERSGNRTAEEVKLYQQILSEPELRAVSIPDSDGDFVQAGLLARRSIDDAIRRGGAQVYAEYEKAAGEALLAARAAGSAEQFQSVAQTWPNSTVAPRALIEAAQIHELAGDPRHATQVLRQAYFGYPNSADRALIIEMLARSYLLMPNRVDVAIARLNQGSRLPGSPRLSKPLVLPNGKTIQNVTFAQAAEALRQFGSETAEADLPDVALPPLPAPRPGAARRIAGWLPHTPQTSISDVGALIVPELRFARHDRAITYTDGIGVRVFAFGASQPALVCDAIRQMPVGAAWMGADLLVWGVSDVSLIGENGALRWQQTLGSVPAVQVAMQDAGPAAPAVEGQVEAAKIEVRGAVNVRLGELNQQFIVGDGAQLIIQQGGAIRFINRGGVLVAPQQAPARTPVEQIHQFIPLSDRIIIGTTHGRVLSLDIEDGKPLWQMRIGDRAAHDLQASDDFIVSRVADENGLNVQLAVYDTFSGQVLSRRNYGVDAGVAMMPINMKLSPDGRLVFLMPDRICGKDLFEPGGLAELTFEVGNAPNNQNMPFLASIAPDHLQISGERVFVIAENGAYIRVHSLIDGKLLPYDRGQAILPTGARGQQIQPVQMRIAGSMVYVASQTEIRGYSLERPSSWNFPLGFRVGVNVRDVIVTQSHLLTLTEPVARQARGAPRQRESNNSLLVYACSRALSEKGHESGLCEYDENITDPGGITRWQAMNGGLCYLTGDGKLHWRAGARQ